MKEVHLKIILIYFCFFSLGYAQQNNALISVDSLLSTAQSFYRVNLDSALYYSEIAYSKSLNSNNIETVAIAGHQKSTYLIGKKMFDDAELLLQNNLNQRTSISGKTLGNTFTNLAAIFYLKEAHDVALEYYLNAIEAYEIIDDKRGLAKVNLQIGVIYEKRDQMDIANYFYDKSLSYRPSNSSDHSAAKMPYNISFERKVEMSLKMLKSIDLKENPKLAAIVHYNLAMSYTGLNDHKNTIISANRSLDIKNSIGFKENIDVNYALIGKAYLRLKNYNQAFLYLHKSQELTTKRHLHINLYNYLIEGYTNSGNYKKALNTSNEFRAFKDSINSIQENDRIAFLTSKFENEKQDKEILQLQQDNQEKELQLAKEEKKQWQYTALGLTLILIIFWLTKIYLTSARKRRQVEIEKEAIIKSIEKAALILNNKTKVYLTDLKYIKSDGNYLEFHTQTQKSVDRNKLKNILKLLPPNFVKVHRSYIVNKNYIESLNSISITVRQNIEIPISRTFKNNL